MQGRVYSTTPSLLCLGNAVPDLYEQSMLCPMVGLKIYRWFWDLVDL